MTTEIYSVIEQNKRHNLIFSEKTILCEHTGLPGGGAYLEEISTTLSEVSTLRSAIYR